MRGWFICAIVCVLSCTLRVQAQSSLYGVNLAGAEFNHGTFWPLPEEFDYFHGKGMRVFRLPFLWERLQPTLNQPFDSGQLNGLLNAVQQGTADGAYVILDPHNYARYNGQLIGSAQVPHSAFADFWSRLVQQFNGNPRVILGLMNEPNSMPTEQWLDAANAAIAAIRAAGSEHLILVPGNAWTGAHSWLQNWYGTPNGTVMQGVVDPLDHYAFELHQYFDADYSGTSPTCSAGHGSAQLMAVTDWLRAQGRRGFLGEFAGANNAACADAVIDALAYLQANGDVWLGWSWWAAGPEWGEYMFTLEPTNDFTTDRPQMAWLSGFLDVIFRTSFEP